MIVLPAIATLVYAVSCAIPALGILRIVTGFALLALVPGLAVYLPIRRRGFEAVETLAVSMAISPIVVAVPVSLLLIAGAGWTLSIALVLAASLFAVWLFAMRMGEVEPGGDRRAFTILVSVLVLLAIVASIPHISSIYYRMRSDAWHQGEMVYEILARGLPPMEPAFEGQLPQYYWLYQAYVTIMHKATTADPFTMMSLVSAQFLVLMGLAIYLVSRLFVDTLGRNMAAVIFTILGGSSFGYLLWLPRCLIGDNRGWGEISGSLAQIQKGVIGTTSFINNAGGVAWIVAKYMHSNPMVIASVLFMLLVYFVLRYVEDRRGSWLALSFVSLTGALLFHAISGIAFMVISAPAVFVVWLMKRRSPDFGSFRPVLALYAVFFLATIVSLPYLYPIIGQRSEVQSMQQGGGILAMMGSPVRRAAAIGMSCLVFIPLAIPSVASLARKRSPKNLFFLAMTAFLLLYTLFGPGTYHMMRKFYFYAFVLVAIMGSWTIPAVMKRFWTSLPKKLLLVFLMAIVYLPTPAVLIYGWATDPANADFEHENHLMAEKNKAVYRWVREQTPVDAFIVDNGNRTYMLVFGQRRTYQYVSDFPLAWRQDPREREMRDLVLADIYSPDDLGAATRERLLAVEQPLYILVRKEDFEDESPILDKMERQEGIFERVYEDGESTVYRVTKTATS